MNLKRGEFKTHQKTPQKTSSSKRRKKHSLQRASPYKCQWHMRERRYSFGSTQRSLGCVADTAQLRWHSALVQFTSAVWPPQFALECYSMLKFSFLFLYCLVFDSLHFVRSLASIKHETHSYRRELLQPAVSTSELSSYPVLKNVFSGLRKWRSYRCRNRSCLPEEVRAARHCSLFGIEATMLVK